MTAASLDGRDSRAEGESGDNRPPAESDAESVSNGAATAR